MTVLDRLALAAVMAIWALHFIVGKVGLAQFPPLFLIAIRLGIVALLLAPFLFRSRPPFRHLMGFALSLGVLHYGLLFAGLSGIDAGPAAIATQLTVPFGLILAAIFFREPLTPWQGAGMAGAFAGVWLLAGEPRVAPSLVSLLLVVSSSLAWAVASIQIKRVPPINPFVFNAWVAALAAPVLLAASLAVEDRHAAILAEADWRGWSAVLFSAVLASIVSWGLWYRLLAKYEVGRIVPKTLLVPVMAVFLANLLLGEPATWEIVVGGLLTVAGVAVIHVAGSRARRTA